MFLNWSITSKRASISSRKRSSPPRQTYRRPARRDWEIRKLKTARHRPPENASCIWRKKGGKDKFCWRRIPDAPDESLDSPSDDRFLIRREQEAEFMNLLAQLPLPQRSVLLLRILWKIFRIEEIARITALQPGTDEVPITLRQKSHYENYWRRKMKTPREILFGNGIGPRCRAKWTLSGSEMV